MTNRNELERLLAAATEGPWAYRPDEFDDWGVVKSPPREVGNYEPPLILRTVLAQMRDDRRLDEETLSEHRRAGTDPWEANARLVVFLRNSAQHYLSLMDEVERLRGELGWVIETLHEINPSNYEHDDVCALNSAAVEVILGLQKALGETHDN